MVQEPNGWWRAFSRFRVSVWYLLSILLAVWTWKGLILTAAAGVIGFSLFTAYYLWQEANALPE